MAGSVNPDIFATGGKENDIKIWKVDNMEKPIFSAKNVSLCVEFVLGDFISALW